MGLENGREYKTQEDVNKHLNYSRVMILCDADVDGSHIKGLCINLFHCEWSSLLHIPGFLCYMNTPILRATKGQSAKAETLLFYNEGEFNQWKRDKTPQQLAAWTIKYYKGLGTSTAKEFKEYFASPRCVDFHYTGDDSDEVVDKVFNKKRADERKTWLEQYDKTSYLNTSTPTVPYRDFIDRELIHFSVYDCERSIPNMVDGLKTSQRKILYAAFKRNLTSEVKVAQFSGYVSEHSEYHHGEASLNGAIVGMAQNFVGSNNINLLSPNGQFGSRLQGGSDAASERYIFTLLGPVTRTLFPEADDPILTYLEEDGRRIEPEFYIPIIPFALVNGISGIGTGFSTSIPCFNPRQIVQYLKKKLGMTSDVAGPFVPYYEGFTGTVAPIDGETKKFAIRGKYTRVSATQVRVTELPVGTWTMPFIAHLEDLVDGGVDKQGKKVAPTLKDFTNNSTEKHVDVLVTFAKAVSDDEVEKMLKLSTTVSATNMHLFDSECKLKKYGTVEEIIDAFYPVRYKAYEMRKAHQIRALEAVVVKLRNRVKYIQLVLTGAIDLRRKSATDIETMLTKHQLVPLEGSFDYLVKMPMVSVSDEHVRRINTECSHTEAVLATLKATTLERMWLRELEAFEQAYDGYVAKRQAEYVVSVSVSNTKKSAIRKQK
jgi:DNA topoisomerase-2